MNKREIHRFKVFLTAQGAEVLTETNQYELVRFRANNKVSVVYTGKKGISFVGEAEEAYQKFNHKGHGKWRVTGKSKRKSLSVKVRTLLERDGNKCFYCGQEMLDEHISIEHLLSKNHGGNDHISNLVLSHKQCNQAVGHMAIIDKIKYRESKLSHFNHQQE